ncbi:MAG: YdiU family protein [Planctomycetota bacterium]
MSTRELAELPLDDRFVRELPADPDTSLRPRQVMGAAYSFVTPRVPSNPKLVAVSPDVAQLLGLDEQATSSRRFLELMSGAAQLPGMRPYAMNYGGHQFGNWAGQLGDGRAINLGELRATDGELWTLQLKGAGPTPYSRRADGFAVLRSSVREFLCSEAMHHLGVPTTRALSLVTTGDDVLRDMFYDGRAALEPGAIVCRVARSFVRFGNLQLPSARGDEPLLRQLADFVLRHHYPELGEGAYVELFREVSRRTARMIVGWMRVGFVHGVMNTDNLSILGETIDYGPYGWLDDFDRAWTPNTTDAATRRYRFGAQPEVAFWNLAQLANALLPLVGDAEPLQAAMDVYPEVFHAEWRAMMASKLGFESFGGEADQALFDDLETLLEAEETDMTIFYRRLATLPSAGPLDLTPLLDAAYRPERWNDEHKARWNAWLERWCQRLVADARPDAERRATMDAVNPKYVLRNYLAQLAIDRATEGDASLVTELLDVLRHPYGEQPEYEHHAALRPDWARTRAGCSMLSCSS